MKVQLFKYFSDVSLNEDNHFYKVKDEIIKTSVSKLLEKFYEKFDTEVISYYSSKKNNVSQESLKKKWESKRIASCNLGHKVHKFGENYVKKCNVLPTSKQEEAIVKFWNDLPDYVIPAALELSMYHKEYKYCGTADIILWNTITNTFIIADYKTNEDLFKNYKGKKLLEPFKNLLDTPYNKYQLQLSLYQMMLEQVLGVRVSSRKLIWLLPNGKYKLYDTKDYTKQLTKYLDENR